MIPEGPPGPLPLPGAPGPPGPGPDPPGPGPLGPGPGPMEPIEPSEVLHMSPDMVDDGFIMVYMLSPDEVLESCGLGIIGVLAPGGGPPGGPTYPPGDIPGCKTLIN